MKSRHLSIIAKKEFRGLFNERTILLAVLLQLFIALFSSFLMVGLTSMYDPSSLSKYSHFRYNVAYAGNDSQVLDYLSTSKDFRVYQMNLSDGVAALKERKLSAVIWVPDTLPGCTGAGQDHPVYAPERSPERDRGRETQGYFPEIRDRPAGRSGQTGCTMRRSRSAYRKQAAAGTSTSLCTGS